MARRESGEFFSANLSQMGPVKFDVRTGELEQPEPKVTTAPIVPVVPVVAAPPAPVIWGTETKQLEATSSAASAPAWVAGRRSAAPTARAAQTVDLDGFSASSPDAQRVELVQLKAKREGLQGRVFGRVEALDKKWGETLPSTKVRALRHYERAPNHLPTKPKKEFDRLVTQSEKHESSIVSLKGELDTMCRPAECTPAEAAVREEVAGRLADERAAQKDVIITATGVVDDQGLKIERLAITEQIIDPDAPEVGFGDSLMSMLEDLMDLSALIDECTEAFEEKSREREREKVDDIDRKVVKRKLLERDVTFRQINADYQRQLDHAPAPRGVRFFG